MTTLTSKLTAEQKRAAIAELANSKGWALLTEVMRDEIETVDAQHNRPSQLGEDELHWQRGVLFASKNLLRLPAMLDQRYENEAILEAANKVAKKTSQTASKKGK